eukprot:scaffold147806_cov17-Prasinocladus_malaysianus.AAC.1
MYTGINSEDTQGIKTSSELYIHRLALSYRFDTLPVCVINRRMENSIASNAAFMYVRHCLYYDLEYMEDLTFVNAIATQERIQRS